MKFFFLTFNMVLSLGEYFKTKAEQFITETDLEFYDLTCECFQFYLFRVCHNLSSNQNKETEPALHLLRIV